MPEPLPSGFRVMTDDGAIEFVNISKERYDELIDAEKTLDDLYARGVDNWEGY